MSDEVNTLRQQLAEARAALQTANERLREFAQDFEDLLLVATKDEDAEGIITAYHFKTGAIHRLLGKVRGVALPAVEPRRPLREDEKLRGDIFGLVIDFKHRTYSATDVTTRILDVVDAHLTALTNFFPVPLAEPKDGEPCGVCGWMPPTDPAGVKTVGHLCAGKRPPVKP